jgi:hypothetical protein
LLSFWEVQVLHAFDFALLLICHCWSWCKFQENWAAKYPWSEQDPEGDGTFDKVRCVICSKINGREKILDAKDDNLKKHQEWKKTLTDLPSLKVKKGEWFWDQNSMHKRIERSFAALPVGNIQTLVATGLLQNARKCKWQSSSICCNLEGL